MAASATFCSLTSRSSLVKSALRYGAIRRCTPSVQVRSLQTINKKQQSDIAFAFEYDTVLLFIIDMPLTNPSIDGVLVRSSDPIPRAHDALSLLQKNGIPFILLTNGGGKHERERTEELSKKLQIQLDESMIVQSHTPFADLRDLHDKTVLVAGGDYDRCQEVARKCV